MGPAERADTTGMFGTKAFAFGGGTLAIAGSIVALWVHYVETLDSISDTQGEVVPAPVVTPPIPDVLRDEANQVVGGYEDHYLRPVEELGEQVADPSRPDPAPPTTPLPAVPSGG